MLKRILTPSSQPLLYSNCNHLTSHKELADSECTHFLNCLSRAINRPFCWWSPQANGVKSLRARFISWTLRFKQNKAWGPGLPNMCNVEKNGEKKRGAEPFESIYLQFKIYKLISCYINIIGWWAGVRYIDAKTESCWSSDSPCWQAKTDTKELSCASPIRDRQKAKLASSKQAEIWNILKSNIDFTQAQQLLHPTYRAGGSFLVLHHGIERTRSDSIDAVNID